MRVIYLDQNKWIDVARAFHGKARDAELEVAFAVVEKLSRRGAAVFPLSWVHYLETAKSTNHERRKRLGTAMWEISRGHTMASYRKIVRFELEWALAKRFPGVVPRDFPAGVQGGGARVQRAIRLPNPARASREAPCGDDRRAGA